MIKFLDLKKQYLSMKPEIDAAISSIIESSAFIGGKPISEFEAEFAQYQQAKHCVGVANGTDALEIAIEALDLPRGSEIIVPANTFIASSEAVTRSGHKVVFCDCRADNYGIDIEDVKKRINSKTKAIIAVHLYGHAVDMQALSDLAQQHNLKIIEDCAQAHGAEFQGRRVGAIGDIGTFSFYPGKNLGAFGDAGAIVTNDDTLAKKVRMIANHGRVAKYDHVFEGRNSRLDGLQAAILSIKLKHLDNWTALRRQAAEYYLSHLSGIKDLVLPQADSRVKAVYHLFVIRSVYRDELKQFLEKHGIETGIHYPIALPKLKAYDYLQQGQEAMLANQLDSQLLSLPIGEHLSEQELAQVVTVVKSFFAGKK
ncbi:MAG: DegT/DnrJ/EryC1/StrS family aminotransferase [Gammaproteobacteria bacterium]|nr:DegT/DnrJ/EryC1/StrS family aminotransferase [Gammaproteobacteria bacterium]